ncbi:MAG: HlyD family secretion protein [Scytonematopsis contorta HA4267-MV1]|nr:HlyD family secretion protein [Scytonematopsis contorta HA4267-MV1]
MKTQNHFLEKRSHIRVNAFATATIDEQQYNVENWNIGGLKLSGFHQDVQTGDCLPVCILLSFKEGINISIETLIEIIWISKSDKKIGTKFLNLTKIEREVMQEISDNFLNREINVAEPKKVISNPNNSNFNNAPNLARKWLIKPLYLLYLVIGGIIGLLTIQALYQLLSYMEIKSAVLSKSTEAIVSTKLGTLSQVYVREGMKVKAGQPLLKIQDQEIAQFVVENKIHNQDAKYRDEVNNIDAVARNKKDNIDRLTQKIELSRLELNEAKIELQKAEVLKEKEIEKLKLSQTITQNQLKSVRVKIKGLTVEYQTAKNYQDRMTALAKEGAVSQQVLDSANSKFAQADSALQTAKFELQTAQTAVVSAKNGHFYDGRQFVGELGNLIANVKEWQEGLQLSAKKIAVLEEELKARKQDLYSLEQQKRNLEKQNQNQDLQKQTAAKLSLQSSFNDVVYKAPFSGSVVKILKSPGNTVNRSDTLILLQPELQETTVETYLTQDQAAQFTMNSEAIVIIPELGKRYQARVINIDRTGGFIEQVRGQYQFQGSTTQPTYVKLALVGVSKQDKSQLIGGMPVTVSINRKLSVLNNFIVFGQN